MRTVALAVLLACLSSHAHGGESSDRGGNVSGRAEDASEELSEKDKMAVRLREAVAGKDGAFFDRARINVNILNFSPVFTSFGAVLSYSDIDVGRNNFAADSKAVVTQMMKIVENENYISVVCLAWHYRKGTLTLYGGTSYGTEDGMKAIDHSMSGVPVQEGK